jgi:hypothetical protein
MLPSTGLPASSTYKHRPRQTQGRLNPQQARVSGRETARGSQPVDARQLKLLVTPSLRFQALRNVLRILPAGHAATASSLILPARIWACSAVRAPTSRHNATAGLDPSNCSVADDAKPVSTIPVGLIITYVYLGQGPPHANKSPGRYRTRLSFCSALDFSSALYIFSTIHFLEGWQSG